MKDSKTLFTATKSNSDARDPITVAEEQLQTQDPNVPSSWRDRIAAKCNFAFFKKSWSFKILQLLFATAWFFLFTPESKSFPLQVETIPSENAITFSGKENGFILPKSENQYRIKGFDWHGMKIPANLIAQTLNSKYPIYKADMFYGTNDTIDIEANDGDKILCFERFFTLIKTLDPFLRFFLSWGGALFCVLLNLYLLCSTRVGKGERLHQRHSLTNRITPLLNAPSIYILVSLVLLALTLPVPCHPVETDLDPSWNWVQNFFAFSPSGNGVSFFFTSGPLGFMMRPVLPSTWTAALKVNIAYGVFSWILLSVLFLLRKESRSRQWLLLAGFMLPFANEWRWSLMIPFSIAAAVTSESKKECAFFASATALLATFNLLLKFTLPALTVSTTVMGILYLAFTNRKLIPIFIGAMSLTAFIALTSSIHFFFPSVKAFANWFMMSFEIARGYAVAMPIPADSFFTLLPILLVLPIFAILPPFDKKFTLRCASFLLVAPFIGIITKYALVRCAFDKFCLAVCAVVWGVILLHVFIRREIFGNKTRNVLLIWGAISLLFASTLAFTMRSPWHPVSFSNFVNSVRLSTTMETTSSKSAQNLASYAFNADLLPNRWISSIGSNSFSCYPTDLAPAAILKSENFVPFPVIQGYSAYTAKLDEFSSRLFEADNPSAPQFLIIGGNTTDQRNVLTDTPRIWAQILDNYTTVDSTPLRILMKRNPFPPSKKDKSLMPKEIKRIPIGEWIDVPFLSQEQFVAIDWKSSLFGKFMNLLYRETQFSLAVEYADGSIYRMRIIPEVLASPIPLARIPRNNTISDIFKCKKVLRIKLDANDRSRMCPQAEITFLIHTIQP